MLRCADMCAGPVSLEITKLDFFIKPASSNIFKALLSFLIIIPSKLSAISNSFGPGAIKISKLLCLDLIIFINLL